MNDELKCPFCQQKLEEETFFRNRVFVSCNNPNCIIADWGGCSKQIIMQLILTRKALEVAVDALKEYSNESGNWAYGYEYIDLDNNHKAGYKASTAIEKVTSIIKGGGNE